jgi:hypothetical protein
MSSFKTAKTDPVELPQLEREVEGHAAVEHAETGEIFFEGFAIAGNTIEAGALFRAQKTHEVVDQPEIGDKIALQTKEPANCGVQERRTEGCDGLPAEADIRLGFPTPPQHAQVGVIEFVGEKAEYPLGMEIRKIETIGSSAVGLHE